jgi:hypothetical protein
VSTNSGKRSRSVSEKRTYRDVADLRSRVSRVILEFHTNFQFTGGQILSEHNLPVADHAGVTKAPAKDRRVSP